MKIFLLSKHEAEERAPHAVIRIAAHVKVRPLAVAQLRECIGENRVIARRIERDDDCAARKSRAGEKESEQEREWFHREHGGWR